MPEISKNADGGEGGPSQSLYSAIHHGLPPCCQEQIYGPNVFVVEWSFEAQYNGTFAGHLPAGARVKVSGTGLYEYDSVNRQITAARIYFDMVTLLQLITDSLDDRRNAMAMAALQKAEEESNERN